MATLIPFHQRPLNARRIDEMHEDAHCPSNVERARAAALALQAYAEGNKMTDEEPETVLSDLLGDLMHWARMLECDPPLDFSEALARGRSHHDEESRS